MLLNGRQFVNTAYDSFQFAFREEKTRLLVISIKSGYFKENKRIVTHLLKNKLMKELVFNLENQSCLQQIFHLKYK